MHSHKDIAEEALLAWKCLAQRCADQEEDPRPLSSWPCPPVWTWA